MISVVIPLYNKAPHISRAIESVLAQTVQPSEIIVVDDGSSDGSDKIVKNYLKQGVKLIQQLNQGVSAARNRGVEEASEPYIAFLDADDEWLSQHLEYLSQLISQYPHASLFSTAHFIRRGGHLFRAKSSLQENWSGSIERFFRVYSDGLSLVNSSTVCARKADLKIIGGFPIGVRRGEDIITWIKLAMISHVAHTSVATAIYHQDAVNRSNQFYETEPPGSLTFIAHLIKFSRLPRAHQTDLKLLFDTIALSTAAGFRLHTDANGFRSILDIAWNVGRYKLYCQLLLLKIMPLKTLIFLRENRHKKLKL